MTPQSNCYHGDRRHHCRECVVISRAFSGGGITLSGLGFLHSEMRAVPQVGSHLSSSARNKQQAFEGRGQVSDTNWACLLGGVSLLGLEPPVWLSCLSEGQAVLCLVALHSSRSQRPRWIGHEMKSPELGEGTGRGSTQRREQPVINLASCREKPQGADLKGLAVLLPADQSGRR